MAKSSEAARERPGHPGPYVRAQVLDRLDLSVTDAAEAVGITRAAFSAFLNGRAALSAEMAALGLTTPQMRSLAVLSVTDGILILPPGTPIGVPLSEVITAGDVILDISPTANRGDCLSVIGLARERLAQPDAADGFVLDGFPRTLDQAVALDEILTEVETPLDCCLAITVETEEVVDRLLRRGEIEGRADDNEESIRERLHEYDSQTAPLLGYYGGRGMLREVPGMGSIEQISDAVLAALETA